MESLRLIKIFVVISFFTLGCKKSNIANTDIIDPGIAVNDSMKKFKLEIDTIEFGDIFTVGFTVKASKIFSSCNFEIAELASFVSEKGDRYVIQYRSRSHQFALIKTIDGIPLEVLSNPVQFNPGAIIGLAMQQTENSVKLFTVIPRGIVIDFDDGDISVYKNAYPIMKSLGIVGTCHVICNFVGNASSMTESQLRELKNYGWAIDSHTMNHVDLKTLDEEGQSKEISDAMDWLKKRGFDYDLIATPYGSYNDITLQLFRKLGVKTHRGYSSLYYGSNTYPFIDPLKIKSDPIHAVESVTEAEERIDDRMSSYLLMNLTFHGVTKYTPEDSYHYDKERFAQIMNYIVWRNYPLYTSPEIAKKYYDSEMIGNIEEFYASSHSLLPESKSSESNKMETFFLGIDNHFQRKFEGFYKDFFITKEVLDKDTLAKIWGCKN